MAFDLDMIKKVYDNYGMRIEAVRKVVNKPLTLTEKILYSYLLSSSFVTRMSGNSDYVAN